MANGRQPMGQCPTLQTRPRIERHLRLSGFHRCLQRPVDRIFRIEFGPCRQRPRRGGKNLTFRVQQFEINGMGGGTNRNKVNGKV